MAKGRKRVKKSCTACGYTHSTSAKDQCESPEMVGDASEEVGTKFQQDKEDSPAATDTQNVNNPPPAQILTPTPTQNRIQQEALSAALENRMNSRMEHLESMMAKIVDGINAPPAKQASTAQGGARPKERQSLRTWEVDDSSDSDNVESDDKPADKKKDKNPYKHKNYTQRGEKVDDFESLMVVTFRTILEIMDDDKDVTGLVQHGLLLAEKGSKGVYEPEALLAYDDGVRRRAGRRGMDEFGKVVHEDVLRHFCYDNCKKSSSGGQGSTKAKKPPSDKICLKFNSEKGCNSSNCRYAHKCLACDD